MIEIEKKYKLSKQRFDILKEVFDADILDEYREENVLYKGGTLSNVEVLRSRTINSILGTKFYVLTYKGEAETFPDGVKSRKEIEFSSNSNPEAFLEALGYKPSLYYEKKRIDYKPTGATVSLDELPFGYYMEIEGSKESIFAIEHRLRDRLGMVLDVEMYSYPDLTAIYGKSVNGMREARFP